MPHAQAEEKIPQGGEAFHLLDALAPCAPGADLSESALCANYRALNATQRRAANFLIRNPGGVAWSAALGRADEATWRSLEKKGLTFCLKSGQAEARLAVSLEHRFLLGYRDGRRQSLLEALADYRQDVLTMLAGYWKVEAGPRWRVGAAIFAAAQRAMRQTLADLPAEESRLLEQLATAAPEGLSRRELEIFDARPARRFWGISREPYEFMRSSAPDAGPLQALILKGLVVFQDRRQAFEPDPALDAPLFAAAEALGAWQAASRRAAAAPARPPELAAPSPEKSLAHAESLLRDLARLMVALLSCPVDISASRGRLGKPSLKRLAKLLRMDVGRLERLICFLFAQRALNADGPRLRPHRETRAALEAAAKSYAKSVRAWPNLHEKERGSLRHFHQLAPEPAPLRAEITARLAALPPGAWAGRESLAKILAADEEFLRRMKQRYINFGRDYRERLDNLSHWVKEDLSLLFDFGAIEADEGLEKIRATSWLGLLVRGGSPELPAEVVENGMGLVVQPNLEVLAPLGLPLADQTALAAAGTLKSVEHMALYAFSLESLYEGRRKGVTPTMLRAVLAARSNVPLPRAFEALLAEFEARCGEIVIMPAPILVRARQPHVGGLIERELGGKPLEGAPGYYYVSASPERLDELESRLRRKGYFPAVDLSLLPACADDDDEDLF